MAGHPVAVPHTSKAHLSWVKYTLALAFVALPFIAQATPADMGSFTIKNRGDGWASGDYTASGTAPNDSGLWGAFTITRKEINGYNNSVSFTPTRDNRTESNGIEIKHDEANTSAGRDKFKYTFTITPHNNDALHTIKIGQASYGASGNSEVARQTLSYTPNNNINIITKATVKDNPDVDYYYNAMGDYFMGKKLDGNRFSSANSIRSPQLRFDSSNGGKSGLYYYGITTLSGNGNSNSFTPNTTSGQVSLKSGTNGFLPNLATFANILKSTSTDPNNQNTYAPLPVNYVIANGSSYISYGVENRVSNYVVEVKNAKSVTITYEGIMNGNAAEPGNVIGETFNEWISFGVSSEPYASHKHTFSGTVFNDNGGINDAQANANVTGGIYDKAQYFNGVFDTSTEKGITGSTVSLVDKCIGPTKTYATQTLISTNDSDIGKYELSVLSSTLKDQSSVCIIETYNGNTYPVQTTTNAKRINLATDSYDNHNFGRVIAANAALVLIKSQYVHDCSLTDLTTIAVNYSGLATAAYSTQPIADIEPGQCIAYRIEAINRGNVPITDIVIRDTLQKSGDRNAVVTSTLVNPAPIGENSGAPTFSLSSVAIGNTGMVITNPFILGTTASTNRKAIRFNTKYGSISDK